MKIKLSQLRALVREALTEAKPKTSVPMVVTAAWADPAGGTAYLQTNRGSFYHHGEGNYLMPTKEAPPQGWTPLDDPTVKFYGPYPELLVGGKPWKAARGPASPEFMKIAADTRLRAPR